MSKFISCDWGTSALRLRVVDMAAFVQAEAVSDQGIFSTFNLWKQSGKQEDERLFFYQAILNQQIKKLEKQLSSSLDNVPLIVSGMASSNIGMLELPYKDVPFNSDGHDLQTRVIQPTDDFSHKILMISGIKTPNDVMRGEETQLIGCMNDDDKADQYFIFTGTHSKHVIVKNGKATDFKTYMTGEFFELLSKKSILSNVVEENNGLSNYIDLESFRKGVADSLHSNLLHNSFLVRTNLLLGKLSKKENYHYLSGLLIGTEMKELADKHEYINLVSNESLSPYYKAAFYLLNKSNSILKIENADEALLRGQLKICTIYSEVIR